MIPRAHITAWRAHAPWASDAQVEQDLALSRAAAGQRVSRAQFEENLAAKLQDPAFTRDVGPLLLPGAESAYDAASAGGHVGRDLIALLPGGPWKGPGSPGSAT